MSDLRKASKKLLQILDDKPELCGLVFWIDNLKSAREELRQALAQPEQEPVAWGAFYFGGKRNGCLYTHCETKEQIDAYIANIHRSDDSITLRAAPLYTARPKQPEPTVAEQYAHRLAILLECMILSPEKTWNEANNLISEYHEALQKERIAMGEPYVSGFGKD